MVVEGQRSERAAAEEFDRSEATARRLDSGDELAPFRRRFHLPRHSDGNPVAYFCGNSLGLQPLDAAALVSREMEDWASLGVDGHFQAATPWYSYHEVFRRSAASLVGALSGEVVMMNSLTVNLHLMLVSFYRPTSTRFKILVEQGNFPSDAYAVQSQLRHHGFDPEQGVLVARPRPDERTLRTEDLEALIEERGSEIALVLLGGVNYRTGQLFDMARIADVARRQGCVVGYDLAHAVGNVPLQLHDWGADFAVWCTYKYLNGGPGSIGGCFVHERHADRPDLERFAGWWGNDPERRFHMQEERVFQPVVGAEGWQLSNPSILAMAPLRVSLAIFEEAGMESLRRKSQRLTGYLLDWLDAVAEPSIRVVTPENEAERGCQISLELGRNARELFEFLRTRGIVGDFRDPDVLRLAPVPLYNTFHDIWRAGKTIEEWSR